MILTKAVQINSLDDVKNGNDNNAAKSAALDHLGAIAAKLKTVQLKHAQSESRVLPLDEVGLQAY
jgi:hypothetical protein